MIQIGKLADPLGWDRWQEARSLLLPALALSDESMESVEAELAADTMQLVGVMDGDDMLAALIIRTAQTVRGEMLELYLCGGRDFMRWAVLVAETLRDSARSAGMIGTRIIGRLGWHRVLASAGFSPKAIVLEAS